jgi:plastocyanin
MMKLGFTIISILTAMILSAGMAFGGTESAKQRGLANNETDATMQQKNNTILVAAGGGNSTLLFTTFKPSKIQIRQNQSITWINPSEVPEPHTITFLKDKSQWGNLAAPLVVGNSTGMFASKILPSGASEILRYFGGSFYPKVVKSDGSIKSLLPNATYSIDGTEQMVNSGWEWPKGQAPPGVININSFTLNFRKTGTYEYLCLLHPWMTGTVIVK